MTIFIVNLDQWIGFAFFVVSRGPRKIAHRDVHSFSGGLRGDGLPMACEVVAEAHKAPVCGWNGGNLGQIGGRKPVMPINNYGLRVDVFAITNVVDADGIEGVSSEKPLVEEANSPHIPPVRFRSVPIYDVRAFGRILQDFFDGNAFSIAFFEEIGPAVEGAQAVN
jgi:hypothetical protein